MQKCKTCPVWCFNCSPDFYFILFEFHIVHSERLSHLLYKLPCCSLAQPTRSVAGVLFVVLSVSHPLFSSLCGIDSCTKFKKRSTPPPLFLFPFKKQTFPFSDTRFDFMLVDCCLFKPVLGYCVQSSLTLIELWKACKY